MPNDVTKAIIFDMDGTLIDSEPLHLQAYQKLLRSWGHDYTEEENSQYLGRTDQYVCHDLIARLGLKHSANRIIELKEAILHDLLGACAQPRAGVMKVLKHARERSVPLAVASSATLATINFTIDALAIREYFAVVASGDEVEHGKPAPDVFLLAARRLGVEPRHCLVIEDTLNGIKAAKAAGMLCLAVPCDATRHQDHSQADCKFESLEELNIDRWITEGIL